MAQPLSLKDQFKQINILYLALFAGQMMLALVFIFVARDTSAVEMEGQSVDSGYTMIAALMTVSLIGLAFFIYNKRKAQGAQLEGDIEGKLVHYRASFIMRAAMIEAPNLVALIFYFLEGNSFYLILFAVGIGAFLIIRPSPLKFVEDYELSAAEQSDLRAASL